MLVRGVFVRTWWAMSQESGETSESLVDMSYCGLGDSGSSGRSKLDDSDRSSRGIPTLRSITAHECLEWNEMGLHELSYCVGGSSSTPKCSRSIIQADR